jgi:hypothetical protein
MNRETQRSGGTPDYRLAPAALIAVLSSAVVLGVTLAPGLLAPAVAGADPSTLCVGGPHCYATIQAAVNAAAPGENIRIRPGTFAGGVTIDRSVNLVGAGASETTVSGGGPVLTIGSATATPTVTLSDLTVTGGGTSSDPQAPNCGPDVPSCGPGYTTVTALGGGVEAFAGTNVTIRDSVITGNEAVPNGTVPSVRAVCASGPCPASFGDAAGIDDWGAMTLVGTTVSNNHAAAVQSDGGGIAVESGASLALAASAVIGNSVSAAPPSGRFAAGGGIFVNGGGSLAVNESSINGNTSSVANSFATPYPEQTGATDQANAITGGVFLSDGSTATIRDSTLDDNAVVVNTPLDQAFGFDAALCACGDVPLTIANSRIDGNTVTANVLSSDANGPSGPSAFEADANATITNTRIAGNSVAVTAPTGNAATLGTVGFFGGNGGTLTPTLTNSQIVDNTASATAPDGAAMVLGAGVSNNGPLALTGDRISGNMGSADGQSGSAEGGGISNGVFGGPTSLSVQNTTVTHNTLTGSPGITLAGGGIYTLGFATTLTNSIVAFNQPDQCEGC